MCVFARRAQVALSFSVVSALIGLGMSTVCARLVTWCSNVLACAMAAKKSRVMPVRGKQGACPARHAGVSFAILSARLTMTAPHVTHVAPFSATNVTFPGHQRSTVSLAKQTSASSATGGVLAFAAPLPPAQPPPPCARPATPRGPLTSAPSSAATAAGMRANSAMGAAPRAAPPAPASSFAPPASRGGPPRRAPSGAPPAASLRARSAGAPQ